MCPSVYSGGRRAYSRVCAPVAETHAHRLIALFFVHSDRVRVSGFFRVDPTRREVLSSSDGHPRGAWRVRPGEQGAKSQTTVAHRWTERPRVAPRHYAPLFVL